MAIEKCISLDATHETSTIGDADTVLVGVGVQSSTGPIAVMPFLDSTTGFQVRKADGSTPVVNVDTTNARMRIGNGDVPTANLDLKYGSVAAPTLRIGSGTVSTAVVNGAVEYDGTHFYGSTGGSRYQLDQQAGGGPTGFTTPSAKFNTALGIATGTDANLYKMTAIGFNACNATAVGTGSIGDSVAIGAYACDTSAKVSNCCFAGGAAGIAPY